MAFTFETVSAVQDKAFAHAKTLTLAEGDLIRKAIEPRWKREFHFVKQK